MTTWLIQLAWSAETWVIWADRSGPRASSRRATSPSSAGASNSPSASAPVTALLVAPIAELWVIPHLRTDEGQRLTEEIRVETIKTLQMEA